MKRIVDGVTYNIDTSTLVAQAEQPADNYNPTSTVWTLYQTRGGAFFIHANEEWNVEEDGEWTVKSRDSFVPQTYDEAHKWVLAGDVEVFAGVFPDPPEATAEDKPSATIYVRVPQSLKSRIDAAADDAKLSVNAWAMRCCERCLSIEDFSCVDISLCDRVAVGVCGEFGWCEFDRAF